MAQLRVVKGASVILRLLQGLRFRVYGLSVTYRPTGGL